MTKNNEPLKIAIPNKGRMSEKIYQRKWDFRPKIINRDGDQPHAAPEIFIRRQTAEKYQRG